MRTQDSLKKILTLLTIATFISPLIVATDSFIFPFIVPKILFFRSIAFAMLGLYVILFLGDKGRYGITKSWVHLSVFLFYLSFAVSTFVGIDWYRSFWDNHERMLGLFTITHYLLYYVVLSSVFREKRDWMILFRSFLLSGSLVMAIGLAQRTVSPDLLINNGSTRVFGTLGNAIYFSGYGLFLMFLGAYLATQESKKSVWYYLAIFGSILGFLGIFAGGTRGTFLGLVAGILSALLAYLFSYRNQPKIRQSLIFLLVGFVLLGGVLIGFRDTQFVRQLPAIGRLAQIELSDIAYNTRVMAWGIGVDAWKEKPVFGWGPNNYYFAFSKYYRPEFLRYGFQETWFDNAHSAIFNTLAVQGVVGLATYIFMFIVAITALFKSYKSNQIDIHLFALWSAFLIGHFVHNATVFENPTSYLYFFFSLAFVHAVTHVPKQSNLQNSNVKPVGSGISIAIGTAVVLCIFATNINPARANMATLDMMIDLGQYPDPVALYERKTTVPTPHIDDIRSDFSRALNDRAEGYVKAGKGNLLISGLYKSNEEIKENLTLHPLDLRLYLQLQQNYYYLSGLEKNSDHLRTALTYMEQAREISPKRQQLVYIMSGLYAQVGEFEKSIEPLRQTIDSEPKIAEGYWRLALVYLEIGDKESAQEIIREIEARNDVIYRDRDKELLDEVRRQITTEDDA